MKFRINIRWSSIGYHRRLDIWIHQNGNIRMHIPLYPHYSTLFGIYPRHNRYVQARINMYWYTSGCFIIFYLSPHSQIVNNGGKDEIQAENSMGQML